MDSQVLPNRLESLGWTQYRLAQEIDKLRETKKGTGNYISTVKKVLGNLEKSQSKILEDLFKAMGRKLLRLVFLVSSINFYQNLPVTKSL